MAGDAEPRAIVDEVVDRRVGADVADPGVVHRVADLAVAAVVVDERHDSGAEIAAVASSWMVN